MIFLLHEAALQLALALFVNNHVAEVGSALTSQQELCADTICLKFLHNLLPYAVIANLGHQASINAQARGSCQSIGTISSTPCLKHMDAGFVAGIELCGAAWVQANRLSIHLHALSAKFFVRFWKSGNLC